MVNQALERLSPFYDILPIDAAPWMVLLAVNLSVPFPRLQSWQVVNSRVDLGNVIGGEGAFEKQIALEIE